jgi:hypothetical protein
MAYVAVARVTGTNRAQRDNESPVVIEEGRSHSGQRSLLHSHRLWLSKRLQRSCRSTWTGMVTPHSGHGLSSMLSAHGGPSSLIPCGREGHLRQFAQLAEAPLSLIGAAALWAGCVDARAESVSSLRQPPKGSWGTRQAVLLRWTKRSSKRDDTSEPAASRRRRPGRTASASTSAASSTSDTRFRRAAPAIRN